MIVLVATKNSAASRAEMSEPAFLLICATHVFFQQMDKKTLDEILRFGEALTPKSQKRCKGVAIRFTEIESASLAVSVDRTVERGKIRVQWRRLKRRSTSCNVPGNAF